MARCRFRALVGFKVWGGNGSKNEYLTQSSNEEVGVRARTFILLHTCTYTCMRATMYAGMYVNSSIPTYSTYLCTYVHTYINT